MRITPYSGISDSPGTDLKRPLTVSLCANCDLACVTCGDNLN